MRAMVLVAAMAAGCLTAEGGPANPSNLADDPIVANLALQVEALRSEVEALRAAATDAADKADAVPDLAGRVAAIEAWAGAEEEGGDLPAASGGLVATVDCTTAQYDVDDFNEVVDVDLPYTEPGPTPEAWVLYEAWPDSGDPYWKREDGRLYRNAEGDAAPPGVLCERRNENVSRPAVLEVRVYAP